MNTEKYTKLANYIHYLRTRWEDESQYEDIKGYKAAVKKNAEELGFEFVGFKHKGAAFEVDIRDNGESKRLRATLTKYQIIDTNLHEQNEKMFLANPAAYFDATADLLGRTFRISHPNGAISNAKLVGGTEKGELVVAIGKKRMLYTGETAASIIKYLKN